MRTAREAAIRMLADQTQETLRQLLDNPAEARKMLVQGYLSLEDPSLDPDSEEAEEAATEDEQTMSLASYKWRRRLTETQRQTLRDLVQSLGGDPNKVDESLDLYAPA